MSMCIYFGHNASFSSSSPFSPSTSFLLAGPNSMAPGPFSLGRSPSFNIQLHPNPSTEITIKYPHHTVPTTPISCPNPNITPPISGPTARARLLTMFPTPCTAPRAKGVGAEFVRRMTLDGMPKVRAVTCKNNMQTIPRLCNAALVSGMRQRYGASIYASGNTLNATL